MNDLPLTFVSSEYGDPKPLTPTYLLHEQRIIFLPHQAVKLNEFTEASYREAAWVQKRAKLQTAVGDINLIMRLSQTTSKGDVIVVHDDIPRITWKMAVIEDMIMGGDGLM